MLRSVVSKYSATIAAASFGDLARGKYFLVQCVRFLIFFWTQMAPWYLGPFLVCLVITCLYFFRANVFSDACIRSAGGFGLLMISRFEMLYPRYLRPWYIL